MGSLNDLDSLVSEIEICMKKSKLSPKPKPKPKMKLSINNLNYSHLKTEGDEV